MSVLHRLACFQNRRDEIPNQELAHDLAENKDKAGIHEIAENLWNKDKNIRADCIKVLYEIGYIEPQLIAPYAEDFIKLVKSKENRLVWGAMIALAAAAKSNPEVIFKNLNVIQKARETGSVITVDNAISVLAETASASPQYNAVIFPDLMQHLETCRPKEVPQHAERTLPAVTPDNKTQFIQTLEKRIPDLSEGGLVRVEKLIRIANTV